MLRHSSTALSSPASKVYAAGRVGQDGWPTRAPSNVIETSGISINSPGASLVALHDPKNLSVRWLAGASVIGLRPGGRVRGLLGRTFGSVAEQVSVRPRQIAYVPGTSPWLVPSRCPPTAPLRLPPLRDNAGLRAGVRLLVRGAPSGASSVAVRLGRALGTRVTGLATARNLAEAQPVRRVDRVRGTRRSLSRRGHGSSAVGNRRRPPRLEGGWVRGNHVIQLL